MKLVMALLTLIPLAAMADGRPEFGVSGNVVDAEQEHQVGAATQRALEQQRRSPPAEKSELSVPVYIDTQRRLADSFKQPIPETFGQQTRGED
jgi:hypothetical protein|tara:strand:- start:1865 stop:2143 length:279 start_codon:yes stop_codon:yes gene_type:complete